MERCPNGGGALKIITVIEDPPVIVKILRHLDGPTRAGASSRFIPNDLTPDNRLPTRQTALLAMSSKARRLRNLSRTPDRSPTPYNIGFFINQKTN